MNDSRGDNCKDMRELLSAYRDEELDANDRPAVEAHLNRCSNCQEELAAVESVVNSLKSLPAVTLSRDFSADIESLIRKSETHAAKQEQSKEKVVSISKRRPLIWIAAAAAAVVMLMVTVYHGTTGGGTVVATKSGTTQEKVAVKDSAPSVPAQKEPLVAESVAPVDSPAQVVGSQRSVASNDKPDTSVEPNRIAKDRSPQTQKPANAVVATAKKSAPRQSSVMFVDDLSDDQALVAFSEPIDDSDYDNLGIGTDEDGLYAIKM